MPTIRPLPVPSFQIDTNTASIPVPYLVQGTYDEDEVRELVFTNSPALYRNLTRSSLDAQHQGGGVWVCTITYTPADKQSDAGSAPEKPEAPADSAPLNAVNGGAMLSFDTTGQTVHISQSRSTRYRRNADDVLASGTNLTVDATNPRLVTPDGTTPDASHVGKLLRIYDGAGFTTGIYTVTAQDGVHWTLNLSPAPVSTAGGSWQLLTATTGSAPDMKQAIGVTKDRVEGVDIYAPKLEITLDVQRANVTLAYLLTLFANTGRVNYAKPFWSFPVGSVLYLGATGRFTQADRWSLTHRFAMNPGEVNLDLGNNIIVPEKYGWDHLWVAYRDNDLADGVFPLPKAAYVEVVYPTGDFDALEVG